MPISLTNFVDDISRSTSLNGIFNNPIYTAILIVLVMMLIIYFMFRTEVDESDQSFWNLLFRSGIYISLPVMGITFLHYKNLERDYESRITNKALNSAVESTLGQSIQGYTIGSAEISSDSNISKGGTINLKRPEEEEITSGAFSNNPTLPQETLYDV